MALRRRGTTACKAVRGVLHLFIYSAQIRRQRILFSRQRLRGVLETSQAGSEAFEELDKLYRQVLSTCPRTDLLLQILGCLLFTDPVARRRATVELIEAVLNLSHGEVVSTLRGLRSVLKIRKYHAREMTRLIPFRAPFLDFLSDPNRAGRYFVDAKAEHVRFVRGAANWFRHHRTRESRPPSPYALFLIDINCTQ